MIVSCCFWVLSIPVMCVISSVQDMYNNCIICIGYKLVFHCLFDLYLHNECMPTWYERMNDLHFEYVQHANGVVIYVHINSPSFYPPLLRTLATTRYVYVHNSRALAILSIAHTFSIPIMLIYYVLCTYDHPPTTTHYIFH